MAEESGGPLPCTHEEIGNRVGVSRVTVSKILSQFARRGWIRPAYASLIVIDLPALKEFGDTGATDKMSD